MRVVAQNVMEHGTIAQVYPGESQVPLKHVRLVAQPTKQD